MEEDIKGEILGSQVPIQSQYIIALIIKKKKKKDKLKI